MIYTCDYESPLGPILLAADEEGLIGAWFEGQKYFAQVIKRNAEDGVTADTGEGPAHQVISRAKEWLDIYFSGEEPDFTPPLKIIGSDFRKRVWDILLDIPYGETRTYGDIAEEIARERGIKRMSAQAVGGAVGHNSISIIIPCHRVVGTDGSLTGYAGGISRKIKLLELEGIIGINSEKP